MHLIWLEEKKLLFMPKLHCCFKHWFRVNQRALLFIDMNDWNDALSIQCWSIIKHRWNAIAYWTYSFWNSLNQIYYKNFHNLYFSLNVNRKLATLISWSITFSKVAFKNIYAFSAFIYHKGLGKYQLTYLIKLNAIRNSQK